MPTYTYHCKACKLTFDEFHSMSETVECCRDCNSKVERVLSSTFNIKKTSPAAENKPGTLVKEYIENVRKEVKSEKHRLSTEEYKVND